MSIHSTRPAFWRRLATEITGDVAADLFSRGRYATDASIYQCFPAGVVCPKTEEDLAVVIEMAREEGLSVVPRGGGTSTAGQALGEGLVVDFSKYFNRVIEIDAEKQRCVVEPGVTLSALQSALDRHNLFFPIEIGSAHQATLGGMLGNNTGGVRSLRYGAMADNVESASAFLSDGQRVDFGDTSALGPGSTARGRERLFDLLQFGEMNEKAIAAAWPAPEQDKPRPEAYNLRLLLPSIEAQNLARLLAGSEGTLALVTRLELRLVREPENRGLGICRFTDLAAAMAAVPRIVELGPSAVELLDRGLLDFLGVTDAASQAGRLLEGDPGAVLLVEFDQENPVENTRRLKALDDCLAELGVRRYPVSEVLGRNAQAAVWQVRDHAARRALALKSTAQPLSFLEDGAVPLKALPAYARALDKLFRKHGVRAIVGGHAGKGALHVRPILNLVEPSDRRLMRLLADEMAELLRVHGGTLTAGRGLGLARSEAFDSLRAQRKDLLMQLKLLLDPHSLFNPGKILRAPAFDDAALIRGEKSFNAVRCAGLALCRTADTESACPSYRVTRDEKDSPRGRANSVRLALLGELGADALASREMKDAMRLCVSCKACKVACPFGIDIPRMKAQALAASRAASQRDPALELYARLPRYSENARRWRAFLYLRDLLPGLSRLTERRLGLAADRPWPKWRGRPFRAKANPKAVPEGTVALFADCFNNAFEPANLRAAAAVLEAAGLGVTVLADESLAAPLCCGRTFYDAGYFDEAYREAQRFAQAVNLSRAKGMAVIGLEPVCVLMTRDEYPALGLVMPDEPAILLFEEFLTARAAESGLSLPFKPIEADLVLHSHCHERALGVEKAAQATLASVPGLSVTAAPPSCCGLNGYAGMTADTFEASLAMAEIALFPAIRKAGRDALVAATGFSCRKQIKDGLGRIARHPASILALALKADAEIVA